MNHNNLPQAANMENEMRAAMMQGNSNYFNDQPDTHYIEVVTAASICARIALATLQQPQEQSAMVERMKQAIEANMPRNGEGLVFWADEAAEACAKIALSGPIQQEQTGEENMKTVFAKHSQHMRRTDGEDVWVMSEVAFLKAVQSLRPAQPTPIASKYPLMEMVPVGDGLPNEDGYYHVISRDGKSDFDYFRKDKGWKWGYVTHWLRPAHTGANEVADLAFSQWIADNYWTPTTQGNWYSINYENPFTTAELYTLYTQSLHQ